MHGCRHDRIDQHPRIRPRRVGSASSVFWEQTFKSEIPNFFFKFRRTAGIKVLPPLSISAERRLDDADSTGGCNTIDTAQAGGVLQMKQRPRIYYSESQKASMWDRW